ncbi:MAG: CCA tRNA nucleotidyltransferase [Dehalococcoidia bacterium]|nr:CCA tRNA nucleotidyltransferase [Dehalococcoidia bacterium]
MVHVLQVSDTPSHPAHVVGGFVRDSVLERESHDLDIVVRGDALAVAAEVAQAVHGTCVPINEQHGVARVVIPSPPEDTSTLGQPTMVDFVGYSDDICDNLAKRDFTVNAIAVPAATVARHLEDQTALYNAIMQNAVDPYGGLRDMEAGVLRVIDSMVFESDPGRLLRAVRLSRELSFTLDATTESLITASCHRLNDVAGERTREELLKILTLPNAADSIQHLDRLGLLAVLFPEMEECRGVEQPTVHFWDVLEHSIQTVATYEYVAGESDWRYGNDEMLEWVPDDTNCQAHLASMISNDASRGALAKLACLLHDVAKPQTKTLDDTGRARFLGHAQRGATVAAAILKRLRFSQDEIAYVETLVYHHLRPAQLSNEGLPTARAVYRFYRDTSGAGPGILYVAMADYLACRGPLFTMIEWHNVCDLMRFIIAEHRRQEAIVVPSKIIDGHELMRSLALKPGPLVGTLLEEIREAHATGVISSKEDALQLARNTVEREHGTVRTTK